jgi:hypothetical protein
MCLNACSAEIALGPPKARRSADLRLSRTKILLGPAPLGPVKSVTCGVSDQATIELRPILIVERCSAPVHPRSPNILGSPRASLHRGADVTPLFEPAKMGTGVR